MISLVRISQQLCKSAPRCTRLLQSSTKSSDDSSNKTEAYLVDYLELEVFGGKGGDGCVSHLNMIRDRIKPDGGYGGNGGNIIIRSSLSKRDFSHIPSVIHAENGYKGLGNNGKGPRGKDTVIVVPIGTVIGSMINQQPITELQYEDATYHGAKGGTGGMGNRAIFGTLDQQESGFSYRCSQFEHGHPGENNEIYLEMKIIADIGLVGLPNAGKSSLLRSMSSAKPKVASYPFTTLRPHVGVIHYEGLNRVQMADIPGLIEGSSLGFGLGISFLKHIERCQHLLYIIDMANPDHDPVATVQILEKELDSYKNDMSKRILGIVANKVDLLTSSEWIIKLARQFPQYPVIPVSALNHKNISSLRNLLEPFKTPHIDD